MNTDGWSLERRIARWQTLQQYGQGNYESQIAAALKALEAEDDGGTEAIMAEITADQKREDEANWVMVRFYCREQDKPNKMRHCHPFNVKTLEVFVGARRCHEAPNYQCTLETAKDWKIQLSEEHPELVIMFRVIASAVEDAENDDPDRPQLHDRYVKTAV